GSQSEHRESLHGPLFQKTWKEDVLGSKARRSVSVLVDCDAGRVRRGIDRGGRIGDRVPGEVEVIHIKCRWRQRMAAAAIGQSLVEMISSSVILTSKVDPPPIVRPAKIVNDGRVRRCLLPSRDGYHRRDQARLWFRGRRGSQEVPNVCEIVDPDLRPQLIGCHHAAGAYDRDLATIRREVLTVVLVSIDIGGRVVQTNDCNIVLHRKGWLLSTGIFVERQSNEENGREEAQAITPPWKGRGHGRTPNRDER